jgi:O-antigen/teichoic acid export membrane protein
MAMSVPVDSPRQGLLAGLLTYGAGDAVLKLVSLATLPLFARALGPAEFGNYAIALTIAALMQAVLLLGGDSALARVWFATDDPAEQRSIAGSWLRFSLGVALAALAMLIPLALWLGTAMPGGAAAAAAACILAVTTAVSMPAQQVLRNRFQARTFALLNLVQALAFAGSGAMVVLTTDHGATGLLWAAISAHLIVLPARWWLVRDCWRAPTSTARRRELLAYGLPLVPASLAAWLGGQADRLIVQAWCTPAEVGWYGEAQTLAYGCQALVVGAFAQAWSPQITRLYGQDPQAAAAFASRLLPLLLAGLLPIATALAWAAPWLVPLIAGPDYAPAAAAMPGLALGLIAAGLSQIAALGISFSGRTGWFALIGSLGAGAGIAAGIALVPFFGMEAAAWISGATAWLAVAAQSLVGRRYWRLGRSSASTIAIALSGAALVAAARWADARAPWPAILAVTLSAAPLAILLARRRNP